MCLLVFHSVISKCNFLSVMCQWVPDTAPGTVIRIESQNQFAPIGADPKELRAKFHQVYYFVLQSLLEC